MLYQWQYLQDDGTWKDILGANSSVYTLGKNFGSNKQFTFRCVIQNQAGFKTYSDKIVVEKGNLIKTTADTLQKK